MSRWATLLAAVGLMAGAWAVRSLPAQPADQPVEQPPVVSLADQPANSWVKRSPLPGGPPSPRLGYESSMDWDPYSGVLIRHGGHNQGGGGEQNFETWTLDPATCKWQFRQPNTSPPGVCCERDNVFCLGSGQFVRFPAFSNSHGWQWPRMIALRNFTAWAYDNPTNTWRNMRPLPQRRHGPGRAATYDTHHGVIVLFGGEGDPGNTSVYDLHTNTWHAMDPAKSPAHRCYAGMAYDPVGRKTVLFGAHYSDDPKTWLYDIRANTWTDAAPPTNPPSNRTSPVMAYDSVNKVMLAVMRSDAKDSALQTWVYDPAKNTWTKLSPEGDLGESGDRNRLLVFVPQHNAFVMENRTDGEQQIWTYRYAKPAPSKTPARPESVAVVVSADGTATVSWQPGAGPAPAGYRVYRGSGETPWKADLQRVGADPIKDTRFTDAGLPKGTTHYYRVAAVGADGSESDPSIPARTQPRALAHAVVSVLGEKEVEIAWQAPPEKDVVGYYVERADVEVYTTSEVKGGLASVEAPNVPSPVGQVRAIGQFQRLNSQPIKETSYLDKSADLTAKDRKAGDKPLYQSVVRADQLVADGQSYRFAVYAYRVRAVNALGVESGPSPFFLTIPEAVENLFAKEDGESVHLKWDARPEKKIKGYVVYRMDDKYSKKIGRISAGLVDKTTWTDESAGAGKANSRRYFVAAVDALGQEGIPSSPVWSYREWNRYYVPFGAGIGTWHQ